MARAETESKIVSEGSQSETAWFCLRTQWKHEHIAAGHLRQMEGVEVLNPRVRFARPTRHGPVWVTEAMFPTYIFSRFNWKLSLNRVHYGSGVLGVVHFGSRWPTVPDAVIASLRDMLGEEELKVISKTVEPGEKVEIVGGAFHGLEAVVTQVMPGSQRVAVLMDFLGRQTSVAVSMQAVRRVL